MEKFRLIWSSMKASNYGPEPLVVRVDEDGHIHLQTFSSFDESGQDGLFIESYGETLDEALNDFAENLDTWHTENGA